MLFKHLVKHILLAVLTLLVATPAAAQIVVIDPGHGGADPGAVGCAGLEEAPSVLDIGQQARSVLEAAGLRVELTRDDDRAVGLSARAAFANDLGATLFVSIHSNSNAGTPATGTETWIANAASGTSVTLAELLQAELIAEWMLRDRGVKRANFAVLTGTRMPAALTEVCFTNNCDPDAALLRDAIARAGMGAAHARAILRALDREPPVSTEGTLLGVVFEDVGVGLEDTSIRIDTASVTVGGTTTPVDATTAAWTFTLAPGDYTVTATAPGYAPAMRTCSVTAGAESWCSVGIVPTSGEVDAGAPPDAGTIEPADAGAPLDAGGSSGVDAGAGAPPGDGGCSCRAGSGPGGGAGWLLLGLGLVVWRRRRPRLAVAMAAVLAVACAEPATVTAPLDEVAAPEPSTTAPSSTAIDVRVVAPFAALGPARPVAEGLVAPRLSPDGRRVAMSERGLDRLHVADLSTGAVELVAEGARVGYLPWWSDESTTVFVRHAQQSGTAVPHQAIALEGAPSPAPRRAAHVWLDDLRRVVLREVGAAPRVISPDGDRYLTPQVAGGHVVFWGMSTGLFAYRLDDAALIRIGDGAHPSLGPDGRWLVFERSADDGHAVVESDLWITDLEDPGYRTAPLTDTADDIERTPSVAANRVAWATPEGVLVAHLSVD